MGRARRGRCDVAAAVVAFLMAIMAPPFILGAAVVAAVFADKLRHERDPSPRLMPAIAAGCLVAAAAYAALAIANAQFDSSGSGSVLRLCPRG